MRILICARQAHTSNSTNCRDAQLPYLHKGTGVIIIAMSRCGRLCYQPASSKTSKLQTRKTQHDVHSSSIEVHCTFRKHAGFYLDFTQLLSLNVATPRTTSKAAAFFPTPTVRAQPKREGDAIGAERLTDLHLAGPQALAKRACRTAQRWSFPKLPCIISISPW